MDALESFDGIFVYRPPVDMRKQIQGLASIVAQEMGGELFANHLFLFTNKRRDLVKALYWRRTGFALWMLRLEESRFPWPKLGDRTLTLSPQDLRWLLDGIDISKLKPHQSLAYRQFQ